LVQDSFKPSGAAMELKVWRIFVACDVSGMKMAVSSA